MKTKILTLLLALTTLSVVAQTNFYVYSGNTAQKYSLEEVDSISFIEPAELPVPFPVPVIVGKGTVNPTAGVTITEYPTYWKIESDGTSENPMFPLALEGPMMEQVGCSFSFEYQVSMDLPGMWCLFQKAEYLVGHEIAGIPLTATAGGVDPNNEALWTPSTTNVWWFTTDFGWGVNYTEMGFWLREKTPCTLLLRKMKFSKN